MLCDKSKLRNCMICNECYEILLKYHNDLLKLLTFSADDRKKVHSHEFK